MDHRDASRPAEGPESPPEFRGDELLDRYLAGTISPSEQAVVEQMLGASPDTAAFVARLRDGLRIEKRAASVESGGLREQLTERIGFAPNHLFLDASRSVGHQDAVAAHDRSAGPIDTRQQRHARPARSMSTSGAGRRPLPRWAVTGLAAAALIGVVAGARQWLRSVGHGVSRDTSQRYATAAGQFALVQLADGSRVTLAPHSTLIVPAEFGVRERVVSLVGEAHFEIAPNPRIPAAVRTAGVLTRVLGTTFDVRRYPGDVDGRVIVWSGKVATGARNASMTLTAGMTGRFTDSTVIGAAANDSTTFTDWARGRLVFKNAPVPVVLATLHEWYGYEFRLSDPAMAEQYVSAEFTAGDTHEMLNIVAHMLGVNVTLRDSVLLLQPARSALSPKRPMERRRDNFLSTPTEVGR